MKTRFTILLLLFACTSVFAVSLGPQTERIIVKGDTLQLVIFPGNDPLEMLDTTRMQAITKTHLEVTNGIIVWVEDTPRYYTCSWEIRNNALFLVRITTHGYHGKDNKKEPEIIPLDPIFGKLTADGKVFADWFSGTLFIGKGEYHLSEDSYDELLCISVRNGIIQATKVYKGSQEGSLQNLMYSDTSNQWVYPEKTIWRTMVDYAVKLVLRLVLSEKDSYICTIFNDDQ